LEKQFEELLTASEAAAIAEVPVKAVYKTVSERLPRGSVVRRTGQTFITLRGVLCVRLDYDLPKNVPVEVRRFVYGKLNKGAIERIEYGGARTSSKKGPPIFSYVIDPAPAAKAIADRVQHYRQAMQLIVEDPETQGGVATFKGTRLPVLTIAELLRQGVSEQDLRADYPNLNSEMVHAARIYALAHPRRGRPRKLAWSDCEPLNSRVFSGRSH
jgi:uncharacterized protein (DUF433 family)